MLREYKMEIFVWLPEYGLIMDGHIHILSCGWRQTFSCIIYKFKHVSKKIFTIKQIYQVDYRKTFINESQGCLLLLLRDAVLERARIILICAGISTVLLK